MDPQGFSLVSLSQPQKGHPQPGEAADLRAQRAELLGNYEVRGQRPAEKRPNPI